jgi:membrane protein YdbS with pleckstrin-like domain
MRFSLRPVFIGWITLLAQVPLQLFLTLWSALFFGGFASALFPHASQLAFILFGALAFFGLPIAVYMGKKLNYDRTEYTFSDDRLEFAEGFFTLNKKVIMLSDVREVTLRKGPLQRVYDLGNIYLATLATGSSASTGAFTALGFGNVSASGIIVRDVANPDQAYERVTRLVERNRAHAAR